MTKTVVKLVLGTCVAGVMLVALALYVDYRSFMDTPLTVSAEGVPLTVPSGASVASITRQLQDKGVLRSGLYLRAYARLTGMAQRIQAGDYLLEPGTRPRELLDQLVSGKVIQYSLTVVEGWTFGQLLDAVANHDRLEPTLEGLNEKEVMARLGRPDEHPEGRFFPETYHFPAGTTDLAFLQRALETMERHLNEIWQQRVPDLPLKSPYEALILASIIEKETGVEGERTEVAGVFIRRLRKGMLLQTDPTVIYGMGDRFDGNLRRRDLITDTPYNTYLHPGLPPTPIALPGRASIAAAVNPAAGDSLYFVADGNGGHVFSATLKEHNRAVQQYQRARRQGQ